MKKIIFIFFLLILYSFSYSQIIQGRVLSSDNIPISGATVKIIGTSNATFTNKDGFFSLKVVSNSKKVKLRISFIGMQTIDTIVKTDNFITIFMNSKNYEIEQVIAFGHNFSNISNITINSKILETVSSISDNAVETLIMTSLGVQASNELSTQYSVRGGSYDENLVYINDIEIFRPLLIHSGQQEGLSIINSDFVKNINFSAGGFNAQYGDKMSSVLDITYKIPKKQKTKFTIGLTGLNFFYQNYFKKAQTSLMLGARIKQNSYLLKKLPTKGNYKPFFSDFQISLNHNFYEKLDISYLGYFSLNRYNFYPDTLTLAVGTFSQTFRIPIVYEGAEKDKYNFALSAIKFKYRLTPYIQIQWTNSLYLANEAENYTIGAAYRMDMVERQLEENKDSTINIGIGYYLTYNRNNLDIKVLQSKLKLTTQLKTHTLITGFELRQDMVEDHLTRWKYIDSAGYSFSFYPGNDTVINLYSYSNAHNFYQSYRFSAFVEDLMSFYIRTTRVQLNVGLRYTYYDYTKSSIFSPRFSSYFTPEWINHWTFRLSYGYYYQIPFYNEMRDFQGYITNKPLLQKSIHYIAGAYHDFILWQRPFKFTAELFFKDLVRVIPFEYENLRIQYYTNDSARGYATGLNFRVFGEFVPDVDSWISFSLMQTKEDVFNDEYWQLIDNQGIPTSIRALATDSILVEPGYIPRATDQLLTIGIFFQDYMPKMKNMRMNMTLFFGTGKPYGPPSEGRYKAVLRLPSYLRADIGFLYIYIPQNKKYKAIFEIDLFNALGVMNVASYSWLTVLTNTALIGNNLLGENIMFQIAAPNYLTGRLINFKAKIIF